MLPLVRLALNSDPTDASCNREFSANVIREPSFSAMTRGAFFDAIRSPTISGQDDTPAVSTETPSSSKDDELETAATISPA
jgi:hypothetical protein